MKVVLFGPPGAGKGTQAERISNMYGIPHVSTGELLRKNIEAKTKIGLVALEFIERGKLAPDDIVLELIKNEVSEKDGFLLDGFPRTLPQAEALEKMVNIDIVFNIELDAEAVVDRIVNRMVCPVCGKNYNKKLHPCTACDNDGAALTMRKDDTEELVRERLNVYNKQTMPIIDFYRNRGKLVDINGNGSIDEVFDRIKKAL